MTAPATPPPPRPVLSPEAAATMRKLATRYRKKQRQNVPAAGGYVTVVFGDEATGWCSALDRPQDFTPGNFAVPADDSAIFQTTGGDHQRGATAWTEVTVPAAIETKASIELKTGRRTHVFACERVEQGTAINPVLPENFEHTDNNRRPARHLAWWDVPFIVTSQPPFHPAWCAERAWPGDATCYELRCLNGGAHDRSTWCGQFPSLEEALSQVPNATRDYGQPARDRSWALADQRKAAASTAASPDPSTDPAANPTQP